MLTQSMLITRNMQQIPESAYLARKHFTFGMADFSGLESDNSHHELLNKIAP